MARNRINFFRAFMLALLAWIPSVQAQCPLAPGFSWPTVLRFEPPAPVAGQPVTLVLGPAASIDLDSPNVVVTSGQVTVAGTVIDTSVIGVPPPPQEVLVPLGALAAGQYLTRVQFVTGDGFVCPVITAAFAVSGAASSTVPALGPKSILALIIALALLGALHRKRSAAPRQDR